MKTLLTLLILPMFLLSQTSVELRGGSHIMEPSGFIGAGFVQDIDHLRLSTIFETHSTQSTNFDLYTAESGYKWTSNNISIIPSIGIALKNHRKISTSTYFIYGTTVEIKTNLFTALVGYRRVSGIDYVYTGIRLPLIFNKSSKIRSF